MGSPIDLYHILVFNEDVNIKQIDENLSANIPMPEQTKTIGDLALTIDSRHSFTCVFIIIIFFQRFNIQGWVVFQYGVFGSLTCLHNGWIYLCFEEVDELEDRIYLEAIDGIGICISFHVIKEGNPIFCVPECSPIEMVDSIIEEHNFTILVFQEMFNQCIVLMDILGTDFSNTYQVLQTVQLLQVLDLVTVRC